MQVTVEDSGSNNKSLKVVLPADNVTRELDKAYRKLGKSVSIKGFRKGKVPRKVLEREYGPKVQQETAEKLIQESYFDALEQSKLDVVAHPEIRAQQFDEDGSFVYEAEVAVRPEFELGDYKGVEIEMESAEASEDEVKAALEDMRRENAPLRSVDDRGVQIGDVAVVDFQGFNNGQEMKQVKAENYSIDIGSGRFGDEFEKTIIGLRKGEKAEREIDFPENFPNPVLAGKKVKFEIELKEIKERVLADLDDEFAKDAGPEYASLDELKLALRERLSTEKEEASAGTMADKLVMKLLEAHDFEVPGRLVAYEINSMIKELEDNLTNQNMTMESAGLNRDELVEQYKDTASKRVKGDFILKKIAAVEEIKLNDEDIEGGFKRIGERYNMPVDEVKKYFANRDDLMPFMNELLSEKIIKFLRDNAKVKTVAAGAKAEVPAKGAGKAEKKKPAVKAKTDAASEAPEEEAGKAPQKKTAAKSAKSAKAESPAEGDE